MQPHGHDTMAPSARRRNKITELAAEDALGNVTPEDAEYLRQPENLQEWRDALTGLLNQTGAEFSKRRAELAILKDPALHTRADYKAGLREHAVWSGRANHFLACVRTRLAEAKRLQHEHNQLRDRHARDELVRRVDALEREVASLRRVEKAAVEEVGTW